MIITGLVALFVVRVGYFLVFQTENNGTRFMVEKNPEPINEAYASRRWRKK